MLLTNQCWPCVLAQIARQPRKENNLFHFCKNIFNFNWKWERGSFYCKVQSIRENTHWQRKILNEFLLLQDTRIIGTFLIFHNRRVVTSSSGDDVSTANGKSLQEEHLYQRTITYIGHIEYKRQSSVLRTPAFAQKITIIYILASHNVNVNRPWSWPPHTNKSRLGQWDTGLCIIHLLSCLLSNNIQVTKMSESLEASSKLKWLSQQLNKK